MTLISSPSNVTLEEGETQHISATNDDATWVVSISGPMPDNVDDVDVDDTFDTTTLAASLPFAPEVSQSLPLLSPPPQAASPSSLLLLNLPGDAWHGIATFLHPVDLRAMSATSKAGRLACGGVFHRIRMHGFRCATEVVSAWSKGEYSDAKELATLYIKAGVPIYPPCHGHALKTLLWRMKVETSRDATTSVDASHTQNHNHNGNVPPLNFNENNLVVARLDAEEPAQAQEVGHSTAAVVDGDTTVPRNQDSSLPSDRFFHERFEARDHRRMVRLFEAQNNQNLAAGVGGMGVGVGLGLGGGMFPNHNMPAPAVAMGGGPGGFHADGRPWDNIVPPLAMAHRAALLAASQHWHLDATTHGTYPQNPHNWHNESTWTYLEEKALFWRTVQENDGSSSDMGPNSAIPRSAPQARPTRSSVSGSAAAGTSTEPSLKLKSHAHLIREHLLHHPSAINAPLNVTAAASRIGDDDSVTVGGLDNAAVLAAGLLDDPVAMLEGFNLGGGVVGGLGHGGSSNGEHGQGSMEQGSSCVSLSADFYHPVAGINMATRNDQVLLGLDVVDGWSSTAADAYGVVPGPISGAGANTNRLVHPAREALQDAAVQSYSCTQGVSPDLQLALEQHRHKLFRACTADNELEFDILLYNFWDEMAFGKTKFIAYHDGNTAVPRFDTLQTFMTMPCPKHMGIVQCEIERVKVGSSSSRRSSTTIRTSSNSPTTSSKKKNMRGRLFPTYEYRLFIRDRSDGTTESDPLNDATTSSNSRGGSSNNSKNANDSAEAVPKHVVLMTAQNHGKSHFGPVPGSSGGGRSSLAGTESILQHSSSLLDQSSRSDIGTMNTSTTSIGATGRQQSGLGGGGGSPTRSHSVSELGTSKKAKKKRGVNNYFLQLAKPEDNEWSRQASLLNASAPHTLEGQNDCKTIASLPNVQATSSNTTSELGRLQSNLLGTEFQIFLPRQKPLVSCRDDSCVVSPPPPPPSLAVDENIASNNNTTITINTASNNNNTNTDQQREPPMPSVREGSYGLAGASQSLRRLSRRKLRRRDSWPVSIWSPRTNRRAIAHAEPSASNRDNAAQGPISDSSCDVSSLYYGGDIENGAITYTANLLGNRPRIMDVCVPRLPLAGADGQGDDFTFDNDGYLACCEWERYRRALRQEGELANSPGGSPGGSVEGNLMLSKFKQLQDRLNRRGSSSTNNNNNDGDPNNGGEPVPEEEEDFGLLALQNRPPWWNTELGAFVLNFGGRVSVASVKNFQLCDRNDQEYVMLQFGRIEGRHSFTMDFQWPLTGVQAFAIAISSLQSKISLG